MSIRLSCMEKVKDPRAPLLVTTPIRMRRYEQSFYARRLMMSFRVLPALHNLHFTENPGCFLCEGLLRSASTEPNPSVSVRRAVPTSGLTLHCNSRRPNSRDGICKSRAHYHPWATEGPAHAKQRHPSLSIPYTSGLRLHCNNDRCWFTFSRAFCIVPY